MSIHVGIFQMRGSGEKLQKGTSVFNYAENSGLPGQITYLAL